ncbi:Isochorismatase family protein [Jeotgalicoccus saudimassiliensis]|uniref:Isochorismatase family protein n=1 Tax=Jeotgalicoccus saudimassiliensis TaxID=1461582 RepID=A0A078M3G5_9STAP|nr:isochorismatase family protein [Jeotgalicoccus saudimassiliensis]CEA00774.1 Isochorismatase family protein [Jeotgalicoccus saudimassiliensis]
MLVVIDAQNDTFDKRGTNYAEWSEVIEEGISRRIDQAIDNDEPIIYTKNLYPDFEHGERSAESIRFDEAVYPVFYDRLEKYGDEYTKNFYGIPPEEARKIYENYKDKVKTNQMIEFVGVETNICVLANIMVIQNIFPEAMITVNKNLVAASSDDLHDKTLEILANMNVFISE